ncbi:hypothetical protein V7V80_03650 [Pseudomonas kermanshahensis]|uniref:Uncharacterized protein n=1 Tax=Pseudomonas kermanshahensis TaxID=2745482 RepID=A0ABU8R1V1_9PSED
MDKLVFQSAPVVELGSNKFVNTPIVLQFEDTPLIEVVTTQEAGFTTQIPIYHQDGTYLTKVVGSRIHKTELSDKAGVVLEHHDKVTVCKLNGQVLFEIRREEAAALRTAAELYTPNGYFVRYTTATPGILNQDGGAIKVGGITIGGMTIEGYKIGVWLGKNGDSAVGCNVSPSSMM